MFLIDLVNNNNPDMKSSRHAQILSETIYVLSNQDPIVGNCL